MTGDVREYVARDSGDAGQAYIAQLKSHCPAKETLRLKVGAQVSKII